ncbi:Autophagy-related protein 18c [Camellia lanceoleosa]|uniref:Autophagy-related protein 18c n=1 Tax=Camellia lanceoleosa TaxID=1840588 RepID=A0ACC0FND0_9ERIC|nr:Autophagy-related protein 18c [Camellia lanceoleosa]
MAYRIKPTSCSSVCDNVKHLCIAWKVWDNVSIRSEMKRVGVSKEPGCSWSKSRTILTFSIRETCLHVQEGGKVVSLLGELEKRMKERGYVGGSVGLVFVEVEEETKEEMVGLHGERLAFDFGLLSMREGKGGPRARHRYAEEWKKHIFLSSGCGKGLIYLFDCCSNPEMVSHNSSSLDALISPSISANPGSSLSFMKGVLPKYFSSEWSFAQFHLPEYTKFIAAFGSQNTVIIVGMDGRKWLESTQQNLCSY